MWGSPWCIILGLERFLNFDYSLLEVTVDAVFVY